MNVHFWYIKLAPGGLFVKHRRSQAELNKYKQSKVWSILWKANFISIKVT